MKSQRKEELRIAEEAARWLVQLREDPGLECRSACVAWLKHSPRHLEELLLMDAAYGRLDGVDSQQRVNVRQLLAQDGAEIVPLQKDALGSDPASEPGATPKRTRRWIAAAAAGLLLLAGSTLPLQHLELGGIEYSTVVGEQRSLQLSDESVVHLNTRSRLKVSFSDHTRNLRLLEGEALFVVARDSVLPFFVDAGTAVIQALGTKFNVHRSQDATIVAVIDGRVRVSMRAEQAAIPLAAGEEARITAQGIVKHATADAARTTAWRQRQLICNSQTLADVVAEVNRYNRTQLRIADPAVAARRLGGVFDVDDLDSLLAFLGRDGDLSFDYKQDGRLITLRANDRHER